MQSMQGFQGLLGKVILFGFQYIVEVKFGDAEGADLFGSTVCLAGGGGYPLPGF